MVKFGEDRLRKKIAALNEGTPFKELHARMEAERKVRIDPVVRTDQHVELVALAPNANGIPDVGLEFHTSDDIPELDGKVARITPYMHGQIAARSGIDKRYYERMRLQQPELLIKNIETWWNAEPETRMARLVRPAIVESGKVKIGDLTGRAWLSDRYKTLDNYDFVTTVLEEAAAHDALIHSCHLDDERVYIKLVSPNVAEEVARGTVVHTGCIVKNSEVGDGKVMVQPYCMIVQCMNGLIGVEKYDQVHLGGQNEIGILQQDTIEAEARSVWLQVRDWVRATFQGEFLQRRVEEMQYALGVTVRVPAKKAIANVVRTYGMTGTEGSLIYEKYLRGNDDSMFGVVNAVTRAAHEGGFDFRKQVEIEQYAGQMLRQDGGQFNHMIRTPLTEAQIEKALATS